MNLTKKDLVVKVSNETGLTQQEVFEVIQKTLDNITDSLANGQSVELRNFGVLEVKLTRPRVGRNPNVPGSEFKIPSRATVKFKAGKIMKEEVQKLTPRLQVSADGKVKAAKAT